jgi:hypothetical protein
VAEGANDRVGERRRHLAGADPVPFRFLLYRPTVLAKGCVPEIAQLVPVAAVQGDTADREEAALGELPGLVQKQQVHPCIGMQVVALYVNAVVSRGRKATRPAG